MHGVFKTQCDSLKSVKKACFKHLFLLLRKFGIRPRPFCFSENSKFFHKIDVFSLQLGHITGHLAQILFPLRRGDRLCGYEECRDWAVQGFRICHIQQPSQCRRRISKLPSQVKNV